MDTTTQKDKQISLECQCHMHRVDFVQDEDYNQFYNIFWYAFVEKDSLWERIKMAWRVLWHREALLMDIVLDTKEMVRLRGWLDGLDLKEDAEKNEAKV